MSQPVRASIVRPAAVLWWIAWQMLAAGTAHAVQALPPSFKGLVGASAPGVVNITAVKMIHSREDEEPPARTDDPLRDYFDRYFGDRIPREHRQGAQGSGFIIDTRGMILTNNHVVEDAADLKVKLATDKEYTAAIVGRDPKTDVAPIRINANEPLHSLPLGDSDTLEVGDWLLAIGNPFGLGNTVTSGIVSAKYRQIGTGDYDNFIQTDAAINPGNSGGPLLNMKGEVVGISSAIFSQSGGSVGIGFAIPINIVKTLLPQLRQGKVRRSYLGVMVQGITPALKAKLNLRTDKGALVSDVVPGGPGAKAGIRRGDVIVAVEGKAVIAFHDLSTMVAAMPIGRQTDVEIIRQGRKMTLQAVTEEMEAGTPAAQSQARSSQLGLTLVMLTPDLAHDYGLSRLRGLLVAQVEDGSPAAEAGLYEGDIIVEADQRPIADTAAFERRIVQTTESTLLLLVDRGGSTIYVTLSVP